MTDDILVSANPPLTTYAGDQFPALEDGDVPLRDKAGNQIGIARVRGDRVTCIVDGSRRVTGSAFLSIGGEMVLVTVTPPREDRR